MTTLTDKQLIDSAYDALEFLNNIKSEKMTTDTDKSAELASLGFSLLIKSGPTAGVNDDWPHIGFVVELQYNGRKVLESPYSVGVGFVKVPKRWEDQPPNLTADEVCAFNTLRNNPHAQLKDKALHASFATKLAKAQKLVPKLADVMHSMLSDGSAFFDAVSFEGWATEFGYDADSRKAEAIYRQCDDIGRKLANRVPADTLSAARNLLQDY